MHPVQKNRVLLLDSLKAVSELPSSTTHYGTPLYVARSVTSGAALILNKIKSDEAALAAFSEDDPKRISYAKEGQDPLEGTRIKTSLGRYVNRRLALGLEDSTVTKVVDMMFALREAVDLSYEILRGRAISDAFSEEVGGHSCMTGDCSDYVVLYELNPDRIGLVVSPDRGSYGVRALLWDTDQGDTVLDRVYPNDSSREYGILYRLLAQNMGWKYRVSDSASDAQVFGASGAHTAKNLTTGRYYPYMDTFTTVMDTEWQNGTLNLTTPNGGGVERLESQHGALGCWVRCSNCDDWSDASRRDVDGGAICEGCFVENYFECFHCGYNARTDSGREVDGNTYCSSCAVRLQTCQVCDTLVHGGLLVTVTHVTVVDGGLNGVRKRTCRDCRRRIHTTDCDHCAYTTTLVSRYRHDNTWYFRCPICEPVTVEYAERIDRIMQRANTGYIRDAVETYHRELDEADHE